MRGFAGHKDKRAFVKRAPGASARRFFFNFPCETGFLPFRPAAGFDAADRRRIGKAGETLSAIGGICRI